MWLNMIMRQGKRQLTLVFEPGTQIVYENDENLNSNRLNGYNNNNNYIKFGTT